MCDNICYDLLGIEEYFKSERCSTIFINMLMVREHILLDVGGC